MNLAARQVDSAMAAVSGNCHPAFDALKQAFAEDFEAGRSVGAAIAVTIKGESVCDLWGGHADAAKSRPWESETIVNVWSAAKAWSALCVCILVERGLVDIEAPVCKYWPEFAQQGKDEVTVQHVLSHSAGLITYRKYMGPANEASWADLTAELEKQRLFYRPGSRTVYHAFTFGILAGEIVRRVANISIGKFLAINVAAPLGLSDSLLMGFGPEHDAKVADLIAGPGVPSRDDLGKIGTDDAEPTTDELRYKTSLNPLRTMDIVNSRGWREREFPASGGHTNARSLARLFSALACGGAIPGDEGTRVAKPKTVELMRTEQTRLWGNGYGLGLVLGTGAQGGPTVPGQPSGTFGHGGLGGHLSLVSMVLDHIGAFSKIYFDIGFATNQVAVGLQKKFTSVFPMVCRDDLLMGLVLRTCATCR
eukprot:SAG31_NODE_1617_length_7733_cov_6.446817_11_plen_422_part_00